MLIMDTPKVPQKKKRKNNIDFFLLKINELYYLIKKTKIINKTFEIQLNGKSVRKLTNF